MTTPTHPDRPIFTCAICLVILNGAAADAAVTHARTGSASEIRAFFKLFERRGCGQTGNALPDHLCQHALARGTPERFCQRYVPSAQRGAVQEGRQNDSL